MFKSYLTGAQVLELGESYNLIYRGYTILKTDMKTLAIMTAISQERCDELLEEKTSTYLKQA